MKISKKKKKKKTDDFNGFLCRSVLAAVVRREPTRSANGTEPLDTHTHTHTLRCREKKNALAEEKLLYYRKRLGGKKNVPLNGIKKNKMVVCALGWCRGRRRSRAPRRVTMKYLVCGGGSGGVAALYRRGRLSHMRTTTPVLCERSTRACLRACMCSTPRSCAYGGGGEDTVFAAVNVRPLASQAHMFVVRAAARCLHAAAAVRQHKNQIVNSVISPRPFRQFSSPRSLIIISHLLVRERGNTTIQQ